jgi:hypothetical protein
VVKENAALVPLPDAQSLLDQRQAGNLQPLEEALRQAESGDPAALARLREVLALAPSLWQMFDVARNAQEALVSVVASDRPVHREGVRRCLDELRQELAGPDPAPLETLLVERILTCWLQANYEDCVDTQNWRKNRTLDQHTHYQKRAERAHRRFLAAVKTLATVRRLRLPALQVNIAGRQVNVANLDASQNTIVNEEEPG